MRRPGLWVANGSPSDVGKMLSWRPGAFTSFYDYLGSNRVLDYKREHPDVPVIIRFQHPRNWHENPIGSARNLGNEVANKWPDIRDIDPYVYFANEVNLHYENGDDNAGNQPKYESTSFYENYANWVRMTADQVKQRVPDMKLVTPPFAFGHGEDGAPDDDGNPKAGWAGFDYLADTVRSHFNNILTFHAYWGHAGGSVRDWLYDQELSSWYAFRWRRVLKLFKHRYGIDARVIIDEAGNMAADDFDFTDQVIFHARQCLADERMLAVTYFLWEDPTHSPGNMMNSWVQKCRNLDEHLARLAAMPDIESNGKTHEGQRDIRVKMDDGSVRVLDIEEYLRGVVPAEMPASWPIEALKAQAVLAHSYAMARTRQRQQIGKDFDVYADDRDQVWGEAIHPRGDEAVSNTRGMYLVDSTGNPYMAQYVAHCGRVDCPFCQGMTGDKTTTNPSGVWGARACQYGMRVLAEEGHTWREIVRYYYDGTLKLSDEVAHV